MLNVHRNGQSLLEVMVALSVLIIGFLGIFTLIARSLATNKAIDNQTIATYLASEGIELTYNLIYHDVYRQLHGGGGAGWGSCFVSSGDYEFDYTLTSPCPIAPNYSPSDFLKYDAATGFYNYSTGVDTPFTRRITVTNNGNEIRVKATVFWPAGGGVFHNVQVEDHFYNWL